jgi:type III restriction enzyme
MNLAHTAESWGGASRYGEGLDDQFRKAAADQIERFRREIIERTGDRQAAENLTDQDLLREVMNTVGKEGRLGAPIRCVVSVSMLAEGWDASTVTHILGVRASRSVGRWRSGERGAQR